MKKLLVIWMLVCAVSAWGQDYGTVIDPSAGFSQKLKQASEQINSIICDFTQTKRLSVIVGDHLSKGTFYYRKATNICLEYTQPEGNRIVMNDEKFKITNSGKTMIVSNKSNPMMRQMSSMLTACMIGDLNVFGRESVVKYYESKAAYTVVVEPTNKRAKMYMKQIILCFDKQDMTLLSMQICENDTDYTLYEFKNKLFNKSVPDTKFEI